MFGGIVKRFSQAVSPTFKEAEAVQGARGAPSVLFKAIQQPQVRATITHSALSPNFLAPPAPIGVVEFARKRVFGMKGAQPLAKGFGVAVTNPDAAGENSVRASLKDVLDAERRKHKGRPEEAIQVEAFHSDSLHARFSGVGPAAQPDIEVGFGMGFSDSHRRGLKDAVLGAIRSGHVNVV